MNTNGVQSEQYIGLSDGRIVVTNLELVDEDLAEYLAEFHETMRADVVRRALKVGLLALRGSTALEKVDYVEKEFHKLDGKLTKALEK